MYNLGGYRSSCMLFKRCFTSFTCFEDVKIIDLTRIVAGPYCSMILGDLGAQIYKVESPFGGDECRNWPPYVNNDKSEITSYFASINRNKKSVCINMKTLSGQRVIHDMAKVCDVLIENYVPGKLECMGLGYDELKITCPHLIYCSITGFGSQGPYKKRPGYDVIAASMGGLLHITGPPDGGPCKPGVALTDMTTGLYAHGAILAAILQRTKTGLGQKIDCNLFSTQISTLINIGSNYLNQGMPGSRWGSAHESIVPYEAFKTLSGYITVGTGSDAQFSTLCSMLEISKVAKDERFRTNPLRVKNRESLLKILNPIFMQKTNSEWMNIFKDATFPCGPVNSLSEVFNDRHVVETSMIKEMKTHKGNLVKVVGPAVEFSSIENEVRSPPPSLGQHTREVLTSLLNYSNEKIETLMQNGDVK